MYKKKRILISCLFLLSIISCTVSNTNKEDSDNLIQYTYEKIENQIDTNVDTSGNLIQDNFEKTEKQIDTSDKEDKIDFLDGTEGNNIEPINEENLLIVNKFMDLKITDDDLINWLEENISDLHNRIIINLDQFIKLSIFSDHNRISISLKMREAYVDFWSSDRLNFIMWLGFYELGDSNIKWRNAVGEDGYSPFKLREIFIVEEKFINHQITESDIKEWISINIPNKNEFGVILLDDDYQLNISILGNRPLIRHRRRITNDENIISIEEYISSIKNGIVDETKNNISWTNVFGESIPSPIELN